MRPVIVGIAGAHSGAGKTAYASLLLRNLKGWGAIKYTRTVLYSSIVDDREVLAEEGKDTRKFLDSGAERVLWVQSPPSELCDVLPLAVNGLSDLRGIVVEGNSAVEFLKPDIIIFIFGPDSALLKETAKDLLGKADVVVSEGEVPFDIRDARRFERSPEGQESFVRCVAEMIDKREKLRESLKEISAGGRISCPLARKIASELALSLREVGEAADELGIKITDCELGCF